MFVLRRSFATTNPPSQSAPNGTTPNRKNEIRLRARAGSLRRGKIKARGTGLRWDSLVMAPKKRRGKRPRSSEEEPEVGKEVAASQNEDTCFPDPGLETQLPDVEDVPMEEPMEEQRDEQLDSTCSPAAVPPEGMLDPATPGFDGSVATTTDPQPASSVVVKTEVAMESNMEEESAKTPADVPAHTEAEEPTDTPTEAPAESQAAIMAEEYTAEDVATKTRKLRDKVLFDMIDYHLEVFLRLEEGERRDRPVHFNSAMVSFETTIFARFLFSTTLLIKELLNSFPHKDQSYGRLHVRVLMCKLLLKLFPGGQRSTLENCLTNDAEWHNLQSELDFLRTQCLRKDSTASALGTDKQNNRVEEERAQLPPFSERYERFLVMIDIYRLTQSLKQSGVLPDGEDEEDEMEVEETFVQQAM